MHIKVLYISLPMLSETSMNASIFVILNQYLQINHTVIRTWHYYLRILISDLTGIIKSRKIQDIRHLLIYLPARNYIYQRTAI